MIKAGYQLGIKSKEKQTSFPIQTLVRHRLSFEGSSGEKSKVKMPTMYRPFRARNDCKTKIK
jgi:hypothetical protein